MKRKSPSKKDLSEAQQRYVERIDELSKVSGHAHTSELAAVLGVSMPSVTEAVGRLADNGIAERTSSHEILLTQQGARIARQLNRRHQNLRRFMTRILAMDETDADEMACNLEHWVSGDLAERLGKLADLLEESPSLLESIASRMKEK